MTSQHKQITRRPALAANNELTQHYGELVARLYQHRGIIAVDESELTMAKLLPYHSLKDIEPATEILYQAIVQDQKILIVGDFDADGATSTALAVSALRQLGALNVQYLVPNRFEYGYGLTPEIVDVAAKQTPDLIITVDNGISSIDGVARANELGIKVLVTDHHLPGEQTPDAAAIVNPNQHGCAFPSKAACGCAVVFYVMAALRAKLIKENWFAAKNLMQPNFAELLDLVALATVADVVPLDQNNRIFVDAGLKRIRAGKGRPGIKALIEIANRQMPRIHASDLGFAIGPRLNAAGRLDDMSTGIECLLCADERLAQQYALELDSLNQDRKFIEQDMQQQALVILRQMRQQDMSNMPTGICLFDETWHQGVIGILASRIKERLHRPVIAFAPGDTGQIKGSARSIPGFHIRDGLDLLAKRYPHMLKKFGGHAMAAGLSIEAKYFTEFSQAFDQIVIESIAQEHLIAQVVSDGELEADQISLELARTIRDAGPWGQNFPEPIFDGVFDIIEQRIVGEKHLKLTLRLPMSEWLYDAIAFNVDLDVWPNTASKVELAYKLDINEFRGNVSVQLMAEYLEPIFAPN